MLRDVDFGMYSLFSPLVIAQPQEKADTIPSLLGHGILTIGGLEKAPSISVAAKKPENIPSQDSEVEFSDDRSSFSRLMALSASAKFGLGGSSGSVRAEMSRSYRSSSTVIHLFVNKLVTNKRYIVDDPRLSIEASKFFEDHGAIEFLVRYGDAVIHEVVTGGLLSLLYTFNFNSVDEKYTFVSEFRGKYAGASGKIAFSEEVVKTASSKALSVKAISTGVKNAPNIFLPTASSDSVSNNLDPRGSLADSLMNYFSNFEELVYEADSMAPILVQHIEYSSTNGAPLGLTEVPAGDITFKERLARLDRVQHLDDDLDAVRAKLDYLGNRAISWNPGVSPAALVKMKSECLALEGKIADEIGQIADLRTQPTAAPTTKDLPHLRPEWTLRDLTRVAHDYRKTGTGTWSFRNTLPAHFNDQPAHIVFSADRSPLSPRNCKIEVVPLDEDGHPVELNRPISPIVLLPNSPKDIVDGFWLIPKNVTTLEFKLHCESGPLWALLDVYM